jgi:hypothetical protein
VSGFDAAAVCGVLANSQGVRPAPLGQPDHTILLPRDYTNNSIIAYRDPGYGDGVYAATVSSLASLVDGEWIPNRRLLLQITMLCRFPDGLEAPVLFFLGNTPDVDRFVAGEAVKIENRLTCDGAMTALFDASTGSATIKGRPDDAA